jgi:hypothetical protein
MSLYEYMFGPNMKSPFCPTCGWTHPLYVRVRKGGRQRVFSQVEKVRTRSAGYQCAGVLAYQQYRQERVV